MEKEKDTCYNWNCRETNFINEVSFMSFLICTNSIPENIGVMQDLTKSGRKKDWAGKKSMTIKLAESYERLGMDIKAQRTGECGEYLLFAECPNDGHKKLIAANFCKDRLCPICSWRRSDLVFKQLLKILSEVPQEEYGYLLLTLTAKNVSGAELASALDKLFYAWKKFALYKGFKKNVTGWFRALEITRSKRHNNYHPHFHVLLIVPKSYFDSKNYITQKRWAEAWKQALKVDYIPIIDVRKVYNKKGKGLAGVAAEVGKYTVKSTDIIQPKEAITDEIVSVLSPALAGRRLVAYGGLLRQIRKELKCEDVETADLVSLEGENKSRICPHCLAELQEVLYTWHVGFRNYIKNTHI